MNEATQTIIQDEALFDIWCRMLAKNILENNILDEDSVLTTIKVTILDNQQLFLECLMDRLDYQIAKLKKKAQLLHAANNRGNEYIQVGYQLSALNEKRKQINKSKNSLNKTKDTRAKLFWKYMVDNYNEAVTEFMDKYKAGDL